MKQHKQSSDANERERPYTCLEFWDWRASSEEEPYSNVVYLRTTSKLLNKILEAVYERQHAKPEVGRGLFPSVVDSGTYFWEFPRQWLRIRVPGVGYVKLWYPSRNSKRKFLATPLYPKPPNNYEPNRKEGRDEDERDTEPCAE